MSTGNSKRSERRPQLSLDGFPPWCTNRNRFKSIIKEESPGMRLPNLALSLLATYPILKSALNSPIIMRYVQNQISLFLYSYSFMSYHCCFPVLHTELWLFLFICHSPYEASD